jgi:hypothetical protein
MDDCRASGSGQLWDADEDEDEDDDYDDEDEDEDGINDDDDDGREIHDEIAVESVSSQLNVI